MAPSSWKRAASFASLTGLVAAETCDLEFHIVSVARQPSLLGSISHEVWMKSVDGKKPVPKEIFVSCTLSYFGKGCTWQRNGDSKLDDYTISHGVYSAFFSHPDPVTISGNDCDGTKLLCTPRGVTRTPIDNPDDGSITWIYTAQVDCGLEAPEAQDPTLTSAEIFDIYNAAQLVELPAPTEGSTAVEVVSDPPELPPLSCTLNDAQACYDAHWLCSDGALSVAYPLDAPVESSMTAPPDAAPTLLANQCPDSSNPSTDSGKTCAVGVGIAVNRPENDLPLIALTLMNENDDEVGETINIEMGINQEEKTGGLGPDVFWKLKPNSVPEEWPVDLDFRYDVESWNWLGCEFISQSNLGQDTIFESRRCEFPCHG